MKKSPHELVRRTCGRDNDRFIVADAALLQDSLVQGLSTIGNRQDAVFAVANDARYAGERMVA